MIKVIQDGHGDRLELSGRSSLEVVGTQVGAINSTLRVVEIAPGQPERGPHLHDGFEEVIHVLQGQAVLRTDTGEFKLKEGDTCLIPSMERHATSNAGDSKLRLLCFFPVSDVGAATHEFRNWETG